MRGPRKRAVVLLLVAVVVASVAIGWNWWWNRPFDSGLFFTSIEHYVEPSHVLRSYRRSDTCIAHCRATTYELDFEQGEIFMYAFFLGNNSDSTVTIEGFALKTSVLVEEMFLGRKGWEGDPAKFAESSPKPFSRFELKPGRKRLLVVRARFDNCRVDDGAHQYLASDLFVETQGDLLPVDQPIALLMGIRDTRLDWGGECPYI